MFRVIWTDGSAPDRAETYDEAKDLILVKFPDAEIGHSGDLEEEGDRTLAWASEADAEGDAGARSCAEIRRD